MGCNKIKANTFYCTDSVSCYNVLSGEVGETNESGLLKKIRNYIFDEYKNSPVKTSDAILSIYVYFFYLLFYIRLAQCSFQRHRLRVR